MRRRRANRGARARVFLEALPQRDAGELLDLECASARRGSETIAARNRSLDHRDQRVGRLRRRHDLRARVQEARRGFVLESIDDEFLDTLHCKHRTPKREHRTPRRCARRANNVSLPVCFFRTRSVQMKHRSSILRFVLAALAAMFALGGTVGPAYADPTIAMRKCAIYACDSAISLKNEARAAYGYLPFGSIVFVSSEQYPLSAFVRICPGPRGGQRRVLDHVRRSRCCRARQRSVRSSIQDRADRHSRPT